MAQTLYEKLFNEHLVREEDGNGLLYIDRHMVHEVGTVRFHRRDIESAQDRKLLEEDGALTPRATFKDRIISVIVGKRRFDAGGPARKIVTGEETRMRLSRRIEKAVLAAKPIDMFRNETAVEGIPSRFDLAFSIAADGLGFA